MYMPNFLTKSVHYFWENCVMSPAAVFQSKTRSWSTRRLKNDWKPWLQLQYKKSAFAAWLRDKSAFLRLVQSCTVTSSLETNYWTMYHRQYCVLYTCTVQGWARGWSSSTLTPPLSLCPACPPVQHLPLSSTRHSPNRYRPFISDRIYLLFF